MLKLFFLIFFLLYMIFHSYAYADTTNNGSCNLAESVSLNYSGTGSLGSSDKNDYFQFSLSSPGTLYISVSNATKDLDGYLMSQDCTTTLVQDESQDNNPTLTYTYTGTTSTNFKFKLAYYPNGGSTSYALNIRFEPSNVPPIMSPSAISVSLPSSTSNGTVVTDINATDANNDILTYSITSGNQSGAFQINSSTGVITVKDNTQFASISTYDLVVTVTDPSGGTDICTVHVTVGFTVGWEYSSYQTAEDTSLAYGESSALPINIVLNEVSANDVNVTYQTYDGSAIGDSDYRIAGGTVTIPAGQTSATIYLDIYHDEPIELDENFSVVLSNPQSISNVSLDSQKTTAIVTISEQTTAPLCYSDNFNTSTLDSSWRTLYSSGDFIPQIVDNRLRLTPASSTKATAITKDYEFPSSANIIIIEFTHYAYSGSGADGMALVLYNSLIGDSPTPGAFGGSLGYAQKCENNTQYAPYNKKCSSDCTTSGGCPGFEGGWLGLGIDEYGNFENPTEGRIGGPGFTQNSVVIRGDGSGIDGYEYLAGTSSLTPTLWRNTTSPLPGDKFRMTIDARDTAHLYVSLERDTTGTGSNYQYIIQKFDAKDSTYNQSSTPDYVRLAFTASTGSSSAIHELDDLKVWGRCSVYTPQPTTPPSNLGVVDVIDNYILNGYSQRTGLKTKISGQSATLDAIWLGTAGGTSALPYYNASNKDVVDMPVLFYMSSISGTSDTSSCSQELYQIIGDNNGPLVATLKAGDLYATSQSFKVQNNALRYAKIIPKFINFYGMNLLDPSITCLIRSSNSGNIEGMPQCVNSAEQYEQAFGTDALTKCRTTGINGAPCLPQNGGVGTGDYAHAYGCYQCTLDALTNTQSCSSDAFAIRPKYFDSNLMTNQQFIADKNTSISFYAKNMNNTNTLDYNETEYISFTANLDILDSTKTCTATQIHFSPTLQFHDGLISSDYSLPNIGDFNLTVKEIQGSEFAKIDSDDTDDTNRKITPYNINITVVPDHFLVEGNLTNGSNGFTYLSNFETYPNTPDRNISAKLDLNITAKSFLNNTTSNYTNLCYAKDGNITLATNTTGSNLSGLSKLLWYDAKHDLNGSVPLVASSSYVMDLNKTQFDSTTTNGTSESQYLINFNRAINQTVDPFTFLVTTVSTKNEDNRTGSLGLNQNALYYYGRVYSTDYRGKSSIPATIRYEAYCGSNCSTFGLTTQSPLSVTWYQNPLHVTSDGNVTQFSSASIGSKATTISNSTMSTINNGLDTTHSLSNTNAPYVDRIQMIPSAWLIYNAANAGATTNDFNVEFTSTGNWSGEGSVDRNDTAHDVGAFSNNDHNVTRSTRKMNW